MKTSNAKPSLLQFLYWMFHSERAGFTKHIQPSNSLILAVCCETKLPSSSISGGVQLSMVDGVLHDGVPQPVRERLTPRFTPPSLAPHAWRPKTVSVSHFWFVKQSFRVCCVCKNSKRKFEMSCQPTHCTILHQHVLTWFLIWHFGFALNLSNDQKSAALYAVRACKNFAQQAPLETPPHWNLSKNRTEIAMFSCVLASAASAIMSNYRNLEGCKILTFKSDDFEITFC